MRVINVIVCALSVAVMGTAGAAVADLHAKHGQKCEICHVAGKPDLKLGEKKRSPCVACHGWYDKVAVKTEKVEGGNPHGQHDGELPCTECHKGHKPSVNYCAQCHPYNFKVP